METDIVNRDNLIVKKINYQGYLEFIYDKRTKLVLINHIPTIKYGKVTIPIFTSDLVISMIKILNKFIPSDEIKINFKNPLEVIAIDKKVEELLPDIKMVKNYNLLNQIRENIRREEAKIRGHILREKEKQIPFWQSSCRNGIFFCHEKFIKFSFNLFIIIFSKSILSSLFIFSFL